jgi:hypothetical protein
MTPIGSQSLLAFSLVALSVFATPSAAQANPVPKGRLARIGADGTAHGWAYARRSPSASVRVYFSVDRPVAYGRPKLSVLASEYRPDVNRVERVKGDHGFRYTIPNLYRDGKSHVLYAYARDARTGRLIGLLGAPRHFHLFLRQAPKVPQRWFEDNNLGSTHGIPKDFVARYAPDRMEAWRRARETMDVFMIPASIYTTHVLRNPGLKARFAKAHANTPICVDDTSAVWAHYLHAKPTYAGGLFAVRHMKKLGLNVQYVALQSVLDKPTPDRGFHSMTNRVRDVVEYVRRAKREWPNLKVGLIDAMPSHKRDWRTAYRMLHRALTREKLSLDFLLLDMPMQWAQAPGGWNTLFQVKAFVKNTLRWRFGWSVTLGKPGATSNSRYRTQLLAGLREYQARGGGADFLTVMSWSPQPERSTPDSISPRNPTTLSMFREVDHRLPR